MEKYRLFTETNWQKTFNPPLLTKSKIGNQEKSDYAHTVPIKKPKLKSFSQM